MNTSNSRTVWIRMGKPKTGLTMEEYKELYGNMHKEIGSYTYPSGTTKVGIGNLKDDEIDLLLPSVVDYTPKDREFRFAVVKYFNDLVLRVSVSEGKALEVGMTLDNSKPLGWEDDGKINLPISPEDYIHFRWLTNHIKVAQGKSNYNPAIHEFYIENPEEVMSVESHLVDVETDAMVAFGSIMKNMDKVNTYLRLMGKNPEKFIPKQRVIELNKLIKSYPKKFLEIHNDPDMEIKDKIQELIYAKVLEESGTTIIVAETNETIGNTMKEAIGYFKNEKNGREINGFKLRMQELKTT